MSWLRFAADLLRDAMTSPTEPSEPASNAPPPTNIAEVTGLLNQHRSEIDRNFAAVAEMLNVQKSQHVKAMQVQRRWNYGLTIALALVMLLLVASYWRR
jgi:hypothetical protein